MQQLREQPSQEILVTQGKPDYICEICNKYRNKECPYYNPEFDPLYGSYFWKSLKSQIDKDTDSAHKAGLEIGNIYPVDEIIRATKEETKRFISSLEDC